MLLGREKQTSISRWGHWCLPLLFQYMGGWWLWRTLFRRWGRAGQIRRRRWSSRGSIAGRRGDPLQRSFLYSCLSCKPCSLIFLSYFGNFGMMQADKQCQTSKNIRLSKRSWVARPLPLCLGMYKQNCFQLVSKCHRKSLHYYRIFNKKNYQMYPYVYDAWRTVWGRGVTMLWYLGFHMMPKGYRDPRDFFWNF